MIAPNQHAHDVICDSAAFVQVLCDVKSKEIGVIREYQATRQSITSRTHRWRSSRKFKRATMKWRKEKGKGAERRQ